MATNFLSTAAPTYVYHPIKCNVKRQSATLCKVVNQQQALPSPSVSVTKRGISISFLTSFVLSFAGSKGGCFDANAAILEADEDDELMEKVKRDRKKRIERQGVISSSTKEKGLLILQK